MKRACVPPARQFRSCHGPIDRRTWLRLGGLSLGALAAGALEPTLGRVLAAQPQQPRCDDFSVILFWANGGPSHLDTFDLKPHAPAEYRGPFRPIATNVPGIEICELLPRLAGMADKFALLRSLHHERGEHSGGSHRFLTGYSSRQANLPTSENPDVGSVVAEHLRERVRDVPPYVANTPAYGAGPAYLGPTAAAYMPNPNPQTASGANSYDPVSISPADSTGDALAITPEGTLTLHRRTGLLDSLDRLPRQIDQTGMLDAMDDFRGRALSLLAGTKLRDAFDLSRESPALRDRYGDSHWGRSLLTCRRLVESGVRFVQCQANFRLRPETGRTTTWDDHSVNADIFKAYQEKLPSLDQSMSALVEDLATRGLDRHVLFLFCGEFGRTPLIRYQDPSGRPGRDHWPRAMSVFVAGGGLKMGQVIGATSAKAEDPIERVMDSNCLLATIYHLFGVDRERTFVDHSGRPLPILPSGEPIAELL